jgi:hypothetical protein
MPHTSDQLTGLCREREAQRARVRSRMCSARKQPAYGGEDVMLEVLESRRLPEQ